MKIVVPENISDITLGQFQKFLLIEKGSNLTDYQLNTEKLSVFIGLTNNQIEAISQTDRDDLISLIDKALGETTEFKHTFKMGGQSFGFHPNLDKITTGEYVDLMNYNSEPENLHKLMAILFRPIVSNDVVGNYKIAKYNGSSEYAETMKDTPLNIVNGALVFFLSLSKELQKAIQKYSKGLELAKEEKRQTTGTIGGGTLQS